MYEEAILRAWAYYRELSALLVPDAREILSDIWHIGPMSHPKRIQKIERSSEKRSIELPDTFCLSLRSLRWCTRFPELCCIRLWRMCNCVGYAERSTSGHRRNGRAGAPTGSTIFRPVRHCSARRVARVEGCYPDPRSCRRFAREFDAKLEGKTSRLIDYSANAPRVIADSYRAVVGLPNRPVVTTKPIDRLLNPARNLYRLEVLNIGVHAPMMRALQHANYTFAKKISHTADSQDQRHRMVPGSRPLLTLADTREPDYITPVLLAQNPRAKEVYERAMSEAWVAKNQLLDRGVPPEIALYVLPNAKSIRLVETGSLLHLLHKWTMRTCFNAQEEIYQSSMDELEQLREVHPQLARFIGPPCHIRAGITTPICTEGSHFCGVKVWLDFPNTERRI